MSKQEWMSLADRADALAKDIYALIAKQTPNPKFVINLANVTEQFTSEQQAFLTVSDEGDHVRVGFNKFVPEMVFSNVADRVKGAGGKYFKKTDSTKPHFKIPKQVPAMTTTIEDKVECATKNLAKLMDKDKVEAITKLVEAMIDWEREWQDFCEAEEEDY